MVTIRERPQPASESVELCPATESPFDSRENVFTTLRDHARSRTTAALWSTGIGAALNAGFVLWQHPSLSWLAAGFVATAAYGAWGLLDRAILARATRQREMANPTDSLPEIRGFVAVIGVGAALWAALGFMAAALGSLR
jgi:hypothetical protein